MLTIEENGSITLGIKVEGAPNKTVWVMADKFRLRYFGKKDISTSISNSNNTITKPDIYNLNGLKVTRAHKGINIINGRKVVLK